MLQASFPKPLTQYYDDKFLSCGYLVDPYSGKYVPKVNQPSFPKQYYDDKFLSCGYLELLSACEDVQITLTKEMVTLVETETKCLICGMELVGLQQHVIQIQLILHKALLRP